MDPYAPLEAMMEAARLLPAQFFPSAPDSPVKGLMRAVLQRALDDVADPKLLSYRGTRGKAKMRQKAEAWFLSEDETWPFSFVNICQALNLDAGGIRRALLTPQEEAA
jgi:hypothetical protein